MREHEVEPAAAPEGIKSNPVRRTRRLWTQEQKRQLVEQWKQSGVSRMMFSQQNELCYAAFLRWSKEIAGGSGGFVEVHVAEPARNSETAARAGSQFDLAEVEAPNGWRIRLSHHINVTEMKEVIRLIESC